MPDSTPVTVSPKVFITVRREIPQCHAIRGRGQAGLLVENPSGHEITGVHVTMGSIIKPKLGLLQEQIELLGGNAFVFGQDTFGLIPEIFNPVAMIAPVGIPGHVPRRIWLSHSIVKLGTDPSPRAQDDNLSEGSGRQTN